MPSAHPRRLNLIDGMILVAGVACCFLLTRLYADVYYPRFIEQSTYFDNYSIGLTDHWPRYWITLPICWSVAEGCKVAALWLGMFSPTLLLIRLRYPRPTWRRVVRQPGSVATLTATLITGIGIVLWTVAAGLAGVGPGLFLYNLNFTRFLAHAGAAIAVSWTILGIARLGMPEASLLDRTGRLIGLAWVILFILLALADCGQQALSDLVPTNERYYLFQIRSRLDH